MENKDFQPLDTIAITVLQQGKIIVLDGAGTEYINQEISSGSFHQAEIHIPLAEDKSISKLVLNNEEIKNYKITTIESSRYVNLDVQKTGAYTLQLIYN